MPKSIVIAAFALLATLAAQAQGAKNAIPPPGSTAPKQTFTVVKSYPHDPKASTQGLEYFGGFLYEGTGQKGRSAVRKLELESGKLVQEAPIHPQYFGRGVTITQGKIFQVAGRDRMGFVYDVKSMKLIRDFTYFGDAWGLTHDASVLVMSDGTSSLRFLETTRFQERRRLKVVDGTTPVERLGDLELVRGEIWAVVSGTDVVARISPKDGRVVGWIDLKGLQGAPAAKANPDAAVSGIAFDGQKGRIFVTGSSWPLLYEIALK